VSQPNEKWNYSNCGYILAGLVLERVTGERFGDLLSRRLLEPLAMKDTGMDHNDLVTSGGAVGYLRHAGPRYTLGPSIDRDHIFSAGSMYSTVEDLFLWNQALSADAPISRAIRDQIFRPAANNWAYGWFVSRIPPGRPGAGSMMAEMRGDMPGNYFSWMLRYPEQDDAIIVLRNAYGSTEHLEENLQAILFNQAPRMPFRDIKDLAAACWLVPASWISSHLVLIAIVFLLLAGSVGLAVRVRKT
jgi:CubicO group peptidase (beta-lactamase class C family)